jgi:putative hemolysin
MKRPLVAFAVCMALAAAAFLPVTRPVEARTGNNLSSAAVGLSSAGLTAAAYCVKRGGEVDVRAPYFNTNDDQRNWLRLAGDRNFCKFTSVKDGSRIHVELSTLATDKPSMAALAYYAKVPFDSNNCHGNPASCYCSQLGGTDLFGGINLNGGGWVQKSDPVDTVLEACVFPDMSSIDSWGLTYHQANIIRGKNLKGVLRYKDPYAK